MGAGYIENIQQAGAAIVTDSKPTPVVPAKLIEFASCGTEIVANHCQYRLLFPICFETKGIRTWYIDTIRTSKGKKN